MRKEWTNEEEIELQNLINQNLDHLDISKILQRTKNSINLKCSELRIKCKKYDINIGYKQQNGFLEIIDLLPNSKVKCLCHNCNKYCIYDRCDVRNSKYRTCGCLSNNKICPICISKHNKRVQICSKCGYKFDKNCKSFAEEHKELLKEWDYEKNIINPHYIVHKSKYKIFWICKKCNNSWQCKISNRTQGKHGCPKCSSSKGENLLESILNKYNIVYNKEQIFDKCKDIKNLRFDFYLLDYNLCIEYQGEQHYNNRLSSRYNEEFFANIQKKDNIKRDFCKNNNIKLLEIPYWEQKNIEDILKKELNIDGKITTRD
jgi:hypothetical protein